MSRIESFVTVQSKGEWDILIIQAKSVSGKVNVGNKFTNAEGQIKQSLWTLHQLLRPEHSNALVTVLWRGILLQDISLCGGISGSASYRTSECHSAGGTR